MALSGTRLGNAWADRILALSPNLAGDDEAAMRNLMIGLASDDVAEFVDNTIVVTNVAVVNVTAVIPGSGVSGPGTGTGTGTIS